MWMNFLEEVQPRICSLVGLFVLQCSFLAGREGTVGVHRFQTKCFDTGMSRLQICISRRLKEHQRNLESCYMFIPPLSHGHQTLIPTGPGRAKCACSRDSRKHLDGKIQVVADFAHGQIHPRRHRRRHRPRLSLKVAWLASPRLTA